MFLLHSRLPASQECCLELVLESSVDLVLCLCWVWVLEPSPLVCVNLGMGADLMCFLTEGESQMHARYCQQEPDDRYNYTMGCCVDSQRKGHLLQRIPTRKSDGSL